MWRGLRVTSLRQFSKLRLSWGLGFSALILISWMAQAYLPTTSFWKNHTASGPSLGFTTAPQTVTSGFCSAMASVSTYDASSALESVASDLTVNLSGSNMTFFSDSSCTTVITSAVILNGTSSVDFYFISSSSGAGSITASGSGYTSASQAVTINTHPFTWTGGGGNADWHTAANWSGGAEPGTGDIALFNATCSSNCSPNMGTDVDVGGVRIVSGYSGTITQPSGVALTVQASGWYQLAGTFAGGDTTALMYGPFNLLGGTFTSTTASLRLVGNVKINTPSAVFNHNSGTVDFLFNTSSTETVDTGSTVFNNLRFSEYAYLAVKQMTGTVVVNGNLSCESNMELGSINSVTFEVKGNVNFSDTGCGGSALIRVSGNTNQTVTGSSLAYAPELEIKSTGGTVTFAGTLELTQDFTVTSGTINAGTSTLKFYFQGPGTTYYVTFPTTLTLYNVTFTGYGYDAIRELSGTLIVTGTLNMAATLNVGSVNGGQIQAKGNVSFSDYGCMGNTPVYVSGNTNQTISGVADAWSPDLYIASTGGTVTLSGTIYSQKNFTYTSGTIAPGTSTVVFYFGGTTLNISLNSSMTFYNVTFTGEGYLQERVLSGTMIVNGTLRCDSTTDPGSVNSSTIQAKGPVTFAGKGCIGSTLIQVAGTGNQTITGSALSYVPSMEIKSTGGTVTLSGTLDFVGNFTYTSGTVSAGTSTARFNFGGGVYNTITATSGIAFNNVTLLGEPTGSSMTISGSLYVNGTLTCNFTSFSGTVNSGTIYASGNVAMQNAGCMGTTAVNFAGSVTRTLSMAASSNFFSGAITVNKTGATNVNQTSAVRFNSAGQDLTITAGTHNMAGYALTVGRNISNSGTLRRGTSPSCGTLTYGGSYTGTAAVCP